MVAAFEKRGFFNGLLGLRLALPLLPRGNFQSAFLKRVEGGLGFRSGHPDSHVEPLAVLAESEPHPAPLVDLPGEDMLQSPFKVGRLPIQPDTPKSRISSLRVQPFDFANLRPASSWRRSESPPFSSACCFVLNLM